MYEVIDIYVCFRKAQSNFLNRGYRIPKDFDAHLKKMNKRNRESLILITDYFNTKWSNIDPETYFECGFDILKSFSYVNFFDERVINLYKTKDKNRKREMTITKEEIQKSLNFSKKYMVKNGINHVKEYGRLRDGYESVPINHYLKNKVSKYFIVMLIKNGFLILNDDDRARIPYIIEQYNECVKEINEFGRR
jgi:hypothetical protein